MLELSAAIEEHERVPMSSSSPNDAPPPALEASSYQKALEAVRPELAALSPDELIPVSLDVPAVVMTVRGAVSDILKLRDRVVVELPLFDVSRFDKLEVYACALGQAHIEHAAASAPAEPVGKLRAELVETRELMLSDLQALARRRLIHPDQLAEMRGPVGHMNLASDVLLCVELIRDAWPRIEGKTGISLDEAKRAEWLADRFVKAVGVREQTEPNNTATYDLRERAYTLLAQAYDEVRRAISHLRWREDDVEQIAPSLYKTRVSRRTKTEKPARRP